MKTKKPQDSEFILSSGEEFREHLLKDIRSATKTIEFETYIFKFDHFGREVLRELKYASDRGVRVRLHLDGAGSPQWTRKIVKRMRIKGLQVKIFRTIEGWLIRIFAKLFTWKGPRKLISINNHRTHRKLYIIDGEIAYVGSFNVSDDYLRKQKGNRAWLDLGVRITDERVKVIRSSFKALWFRWRFREDNFDLELSQNVRTSLGLRSRIRILTELCEQIRNAKSRVWIMTPYMFPQSKLARALRIAAIHKVDVSLLVPSRSDVRFYTLISRLQYAGLLAYGVKIYEFTPSFLHAKVMIVDDDYWVGSSNFNHRSFLKDLELDVRLVSKSARAAIDKVWHDCVSESNLIDSVDVIKMTWFQAWVGRQFLRFRAWL